MRANHWLQVAALASALGMTGPAIAQGVDRSTSTGNGVTAATGESPAAGAIVMPQDRAMLNNDNDRAEDRNGNFNDDTSASNDDRLSVNPGPSRDSMSVNPRESNDDMSVDPGRAETDRDALRYVATGASRPSSTGEVAPLDDNEATPARTGSDVQPGDMGPADMRGE
jgi:hypothetical protein